MRKYISISLNLEESIKDLADKKITLTVSDDGEETKGNLEYIKIGSQFSLDIKGFAVGYLDHVVDKLAKEGIFKDTITNYPDALLSFLPEYNSSKSIDIKIAFPDGQVVEKKITGNTNPYHNLAYEMLLEPFKKCLIGLQPTDFNNEKLSNSITESDGKINIIENTTTVDNKLKGTYENGETPQERLRNLLTPFFTLASIVESENFTASNLESNQQLYALVKASAKTCFENKDRIRDYLTDIPKFYKK